MAITPANRAKIGARYMTPRNSIVTVIGLIGDQVQLENGAGAKFSVPGTYPLTIMDDDRPPVEAPVVGLPIEQLRERLARKPGQPGYLDDADLEDLVEHDQRIEVAELVTGELERRAAPPETEAPAAAATDLGSPGALFTPPPSSAPAPAPTPPPADPFAGATSVEARERVIRTWTTLDQVEAGRAVPNLQGTVIRDLDAQARYLAEAATAGALEDLEARVQALQEIAGRKRLADRPGVLAKVRELIAEARGAGATVVPSVTAAPPALELEGDERPTVLNGDTCDPADRGLLGFLVTHYPLPDQSARAVDLAAVKAMVGNVRDSRAALKSTTDARLVVMAILWAEETNRPATIVDQLEARVKALGALDQLEAERAERDGVAAARADVQAETVPEAGGRSTAYMAGRAAFMGGRYGSCSEAQADPELRDHLAEDFEAGWTEAEALAAEEPAYVKRIEPASTAPADGPQLTEGQADSPWAILFQVNTIRSSAAGAVAHLVGLIQACDNYRALDLAHQAECARKLTARAEIVIALETRISELVPVPTCGARFSHTGHPCTLAPHAGRDHLYEPDQVGWTAPPAAKAPAVTPEAAAEIVRAAAPHAAAAARALEAADPAESMALLAVSGASLSELRVLEGTEARPAVLAAIRARLVELAPPPFRWTAETLETLDRDELLNLLEGNPDADQEALIRARLDVIDPPPESPTPAPVEDLSGLSLAEGLNTGRLTLARALELVELATLPELLALPENLRHHAGVSSVVGQAVTARIRLLTPPPTVRALQQEALARDVAASDLAAPSVTEAEARELHHVLARLELKAPATTLRPWDGVDVTLKPAEARRYFRERVDGPGEFREEAGRPFAGLLAEARAALAIVDELGPLEEPEATEGLGEACEGCKAPAVTRDSTGVPLCGPCYDALPVAAPEAPPAPPALEAGAPKARPAVQVQDLVVVNLPDGTADLWARPAGASPWCLGKTTDPRLGEAMRLYGLHLAELEAAKAPADPLAAALRGLVAFVKDAAHNGVRVEIKITPETAAP